MASQVVFEDLDRYTRVAAFRGKFYVLLLSGGLQRWGASIMPVGKDYSTMNSTLWKRSGLVGNPARALPTTNGQTYYFVTESEAEEAAVEFLNQLQSKGIKL